MEEFNARRDVPREESTGHGSCVKAGAQLFCTGHDLHVLQRFLFEIRDDLVGLALTVFVPGINDCEDVPAICDSDTLSHVRKVYAWDRQCAVLNRMAGVD